MDASLTDDKMEGYFKISQSNQTKNIGWKTLTRDVIQSIFAEK